jgi:hypothetical protein
MNSESAYREAERAYGHDPDAFWEYLERHKLDDWTLAIGWAFVRAKRFRGWDQTTVSARTAVTDHRGRIIEEPISKTFITSMLSGKSHPAPPTYARLARAMEISPLVFYLAEGWLDPADIASYDLPEREESLPVIQRLAKLPEEQRPKARALIFSILDSIYDVEQYRQAPKSSPSKEQSRLMVQEALAARADTVVRSAERLPRRR